MEYRFTTRSVILFGQFLKYFEGEIDELVEIFTNMDNILELQPEKIISLIIKVVGSASNAEEILINILSVGLDQSPLQIRQMDGYEFTKTLKDYMMSINWNKLMGESLGLILSLPESQQATNLAQ